MEQRNARQPTAASVHVRRRGFRLLSDRNDTTDAQLRNTASNPDTDWRLLPQPYLPDRRAIDNHRTCSTPSEHRFHLPYVFLSSSGPEPHPPTILNTLSCDNTLDQPPSFKKFSSFYDDDNDVQTVDFHRTMHEILDSLKSETTLDGLVRAAMLSDRADDAGPLIMTSKSESHRHADPVEEHKQSIPSISPTRTSELATRASACSTPVQPDNSIASSLKSSSRHLKRTANTYINLSWNSSEVAERYRLHLGVDSLEKRHSTEIRRIESNILTFFPIGQRESKSPSSNNSQLSALDTASRMQGLLQYVQKYNTSNCLILEICWSILTAHEPPKEELLNLIALTLLLNQVMLERVDCSSARTSTNHQTPRAIQERTNADCDVFIRSTIGYPHPPGPCITLGNLGAMPKTGHSKCKKLLEEEKIPHG